MEIIRTHLARRLLLLGNGKISSPMIGICAISTHLINRYHSIGRSVGRYTEHQLHRIVLSPREVYNLPSLKRPFITQTQ